MSAPKFELDMTSGTWLDRHHRAQGELRHIVNRLHSLSISFFNVGNPIIGQELDLMADDLEKAREMERDAVSETLNESCRAAQQGSVNILQAVLAGAQLERQSKKHRILFMQFCNNNQDWQLMRPPGRFTQEPYRLRTCRFPFTLRLVAGSGPLQFILGTF